ncbi:hypothetical protein DIE23_27115 [Burkholderia sp. Bp9143]|uniref:hypothetical protein n=1 Tax=Burkholderia sp. Bp9143 TaxID=2184574 RepID=UPI000F5958C6|nr:hypothetical protein [Burkholderia sp. Bp9143]RQR27349.1 hypothetical protein DIE23_27115 [Burkholderia sp. Bp9143]
MGAIHSWILFASASAILGIAQPADATLDGRQCFHAGVWLELAAFSVRPRLDGQQCAQLRQRDFPDPADALRAASLDAGSAAASAH